MKLALLPASPAAALHIRRQRPADFLFKAETAAAKTAAVADAVNGRSEAWMLPLLSVLLLLLVLVLLLLLLLLLLLFLLLLCCLR